MSRARQTDQDARDAYDWMLQEHARPWCWACGRTQRERPDWWHATWIIQRHHLVRAPRVPDRRAVILLCPVCHGRCHGERYPRAPGAPPSLSGLLWLKREHDGPWYDRRFLAAHHVGRLPRAAAIFREYRRDYCQRHGDAIRLPGPGTTPR